MRPEEKGATVAASACKERNVRRRRGPLARAEMPERAARRRVERDVRAIARRDVRDVRVGIDTLEPRADGQPRRLAPECGGDFAEVLVLGSAARQKRLRRRVVDEEEDVRIPQDIREGRQRKPRPEGFERLDLILASPELPNPTRGHAPPAEQRRGVVSAEDDRADAAGALSVRINHASRPPAAEVVDAARFRDLHDAPERKESTAQQGV